MEYRVNEDIVEVVSNVFGKLIIQRGYKFTFLGIDIELTDNGKVKIVMKGYLLEVIDMFGGDVLQPVISASKHHRI